MTILSAGIPYVTLAAASSAITALGVGGVAEAQRMLTVLLADAHRVQDGPPPLYRARSRTTGWDVSARVSIEPPLAVVVSVNVRRMR